MGKKNNDNIKLSDIYIGCSDGELEANENNFLNLFYNGNHKYKTIISNKSKFIISGRKGSGKTILSKYIEKKELENKKLCKIFKMGDFNMRCLIDLDLRDLYPKELSHFWHWTILIGLTELLLKNPPKIYEIKKYYNYLKLNNFYKSLYPKSKNNPSFIQTSFEEANSSSIKGSLKRTSIDISTSSDTEKAYSIKTNYKKAAYYNLLDKLSTLVINCIHYYDITLIYDDLDGIEDTIQDDSSYRNILISLINTIKDININYQYNNINCRLIVVIRDDIINALHSYNSNLSKITSDCEVKLYWGDIPENNHPEKHPLMDLVITKIKKSVPEFSQMSKKNLYKRLFPNKIDNKTVSSYLLNYSFARPRDIINYLNIIKTNNPNEVAFTASLFRANKIAYSNNFYNELRNELSIHYKIEFIDDCLNLLGDLKQIYFSYNQIKNFYNVNISRYPNIENIETCINFLYKFSIIGNSWISNPDDSKPKYKHSWAYRADGNPYPNFDHNFVIHNALQKHYSL